MRIESVKAEELTPDLVERWIEIQRSEPIYHNPFARPEFTLAVAAARSDVEVAILEEAGRVVGFFPFQRSRWNHGRPVGSRVADFQVAIISPEVHWTADELIRGCRLDAWEFNQVHGLQAQFQPFAIDHNEAVFIDVSRGYEPYAEHQRLRGSDKLKEINRQTKKAVRELGPLRFELHDSDPLALQQLLTWKSAQYDRTGATNVLSYPWVRKLIRETLVEQTQGFSGWLSSIYFGDQLAAIEVALRSHEVSYSWFTTYNREFSIHSPGSILAVELIKRLSGVGVERLELGRNNLPYKRSFATGGYPVFAGSVAVRPAARLLRLGRQKAVQLSRNRWMTQPVRLAKRVVNPIRGWLTFR